MKVLEKTIYNRYIDPRNVFDKKVGITKEYEIKNETDNILEWYEWKCGQKIIERICKDKHNDGCIWKIKNGILHIVMLWGAVKGGK